MANSGFQVPGRRPISRRKVWAGVALTIVLFSLASWLWVESVTARKWTAMERGVADLEREEKDADCRRPVLRGEAVDGDAWEHYTVALDRLKAPRPVLVAIGTYIERKPEADRVAVEAALAENAGALEALREGSGGARRDARSRSGL